VEAALDTKVVAVSMNILMGKEVQVVQVAQAVQAVRMVQVGMVLLVVVSVAGEEVEVTVLQEGVGEEDMAVGIVLTSSGRDPEVMTMSAIQNGKGISVYRNIRQGARITQDDRIFRAHVLVRFYFGSCVSVWRVYFPFCGLLFLFILCSKPCRVSIPAVLRLEMKGLEVFRGIFLCYFLSMIMC